MSNSSKTSRNYSTCHPISTLQIVLLSRSVSRRTNNKIKQSQYIAPPTQHSALPDCGLSSSPASWVTPTLAHTSPSTPIVLDPSYFKFYPPNFSPPSIPLSKPMVRMFLVTPSLTLALIPFGPLLHWQCILPMFLSVYIIMLIGGWSRNAFLCCPQSLNNVTNQMQQTRIQVTNTVLHWQQVVSRLFQQKSLLEPKFHKPLQSANCIHNIAHAKQASKQAATRRRTKFVLFCWRLNQQQDSVLQGKAQVLIHSTTSNPKKMVQSCKYQ